MSNPKCPYTSVSQKRCNKSLSFLNHFIIHSFHSLNHSASCHQFAQQHSQINVQKQSYPNHPLFFNTSSWPFFKSSPSACRHFFFFYLSYSSSVDHSPMLDVFSAAVVLLLLSACCSRARWAVAGR